MSASAEGWWSMPEDETRPLNPVPDEPARWSTGLHLGGSPEVKYVGPPRLTGWPLALVIITLALVVGGLLFFFMLIVFSDQIQALSSPVVWVE